MLQELSMIRMASTSKQNISMVYAVEAQEIPESTDSTY
jgi:hypothetical protein